MKLKFLNIKTQGFLKKNKTLRLSLPYSEAKTIGLIFTVEDKDKHGHVKDLMKKLEHDGKQVQVIEYLPQKKQNYEFLFDFFTDQEVSFWGNVTSAAALKFSDISFDFLFYLDTKPNPLILNLLARSKAKCRIGRFWKEGEPYFEFMIEANNGTKGLIDGMYKYTSLLK